LPLAGAPVGAPAGPLLAADAVDTPICMNAADNRAVAAARVSFLFCRQLLFWVFLLRLIRTRIRSFADEWAIPMGGVNNRESRPGTVRAQSYIRGRSPSLPKRSSLDIQVFHQGG